MLFSFSNLIDLIDVVYRLIKSMPKDMFLQQESQKQTKKNALTFSNALAKLQK
jgi:hypothetical protein